MFCAYTRPRYQVSFYRTIGPLAFWNANKNLQVAGKNRVGSETGNIHIFFLTKMAKNLPSVVNTMRISSEFSLETRRCNGQNSSSNKFLI